MFQAIAVTRGLDQAQFGAIIATVQAPLYKVDTCSPFTPAGYVRAKEAWAIIGHECGRGSRMAQMRVFRNKILKSPTKRKSIKYYRESEVRMVAAVLQRKLKADRDWNNLINGNPTITN